MPLSLSSRLGWVGFGPHKKGGNKNDVYMIGNSSFLVCLASLFYFCLLVAPINFLSNSSFFIFNIYFMFFSTAFLLLFNNNSRRKRGEEKESTSSYSILLLLFALSLSASVRCFFSFSHFVCFMKLMLENRTQLVGILYLFICCCCSSNRKRVWRTWVANIYVYCMCVCVCAMARVSRAMAHECRL